MTNNGENLVVGALVQWSGDKGYGVITSVDDKVILVQWDAAGLPPRFVASDPPLTRVAIQGQTLRRKSDGRNAIAMMPVVSALPAWQCFVATPDGNWASVNIPEADLRPVPATDPVDRFEAGDIGSLAKYRLQEVTRWYRTMHRHNDLVSLGNVRVDIKPHQVGVVHKVISNYPHRFLLCDEVGLGKTVEAGMALKELRARGGAERVLAIVPSNLVGQWQFEMKSKFNEDFAVLNTNHVQALGNLGWTNNPFTRFDKVLCSSSWVSQPKWSELCTQVDWDLVIVDEAHHARSQLVGGSTNTTRLYRLVSKLASPEHVMRRGMLFLTATPMQLSTHELYSLVELLDPGLFPSEAEFDKHRSSLQGLNQLVERLQSPGFQLPKDDTEEIAERVSQWLDLEVHEARRRLTAGPDDLEVLAKELSDRHLLSEVLIRNRKAVVGGFMPRVAHRWEVELTSEERRALQAVEEYIQYSYLAESSDGNVAGFVMATSQKLMASSLAAIRASLNRRHSKITTAGHLASAADDVSPDDRLDNDDNASDVIMDSVPGGAASQEISLLEAAIEAIDSVPRDSKANVLMEQLTGLFADHPDEKVLVFTQFRETQHYLEDLISAKGWEANLFHGQMKADEKDRAVARFRDNSGPQVLISTEAGGEGRNLQFCHLLVNYDLPWNPMKVEQRIGRVDRIGQEHTVNIYNLWVKNTIEERILDVLENRIRVFQETVGGLDPILGEAESEIRAIMRSPVEDKKSAIEEFGIKVESQISVARQAGEQLGDFIMDTKSYSKEIAEQIIGQPSPIDNDDMEKFIGQLLADVGTYIMQTDGLYRLTFRGDFAETHKSQLFLGGMEKQAVFRPDRQTDSEDVNFMAFGNPIVDAIVEQVLAEGYEGTTGTRRIPATKDLHPTTGWLFTYQFTTPAPGVRGIEHLVPIFVPDVGGQADTDLGWRIVARAFHFDPAEGEIAREHIPDNISQAAQVASERADVERESLQREATEQAAGRFEREIARLESWFQYRQRVANDRAAATEATLNRLYESEDDGQRRIIPVWEANLRRDQELPSKLAEERRRLIADAEGYRYPQVDWALKSIGRIEVVDAG